MTVTPASVSAWYFFMGLFFCLFSRSHQLDETHWGYALSGITCLILAAWFATLHIRRGTVEKPGPLE